MEGNAYRPPAPPNPDHPGEDPLPLEEVFSRTLPALVNGESAPLKKEWALRKEANLEANDLFLEKAHLVERMQSGDDSEETLARLEEINRELQAIDAEFFERRQQIQ
jgi:hypothetical protein